MNPMLISAIIIIIFQIRIRSVDAIVIKCNQKTELQMDSALAKILVVGQNKLKFPENSQELRIYCNDAIHFVETVSQYTKKCLPPLGRDSAAVLLHSVRNELKTTCKSGRLNKKAKDLLSAAPCANAGLKSFYKCNVRAIDAYMGILSADVKMRIPMACCNFHELRKCLVNEAEDVKQCSRRTIDFVDKFIYKMFEGILQLLCGQYDESNANCDVIVSETPQRDSHIKRSKSLLLPTFKIAMSLQEVPET